MNLDQIFKNILTDVKVELHDEFDNNFERKAFFDKPWPKEKIANNKGSLMSRSGNLRRANKSQVIGNTITFSNSLPYASIHNNGGFIVVTDKMIRFFWAMFYKSSGAIGKRKDGSASQSKRNLNLTAEAAKWKALALMKAGTKIKIEQRQWVGFHPALQGHIEPIINENLKQVNDLIHQQLG